MTLQEEMQEKIKILHDSKIKVCIAVTGGGAGLQNLISQVPGASATLLECFFPYSKEAMVEFLGFEPEKFASEETALFIAAKAWRKATAILAKQGKDTRDAVGIGVTAAIATNRLLRNEHRVFVAARTAKEFFVVKIVFPKKEDGSSELGRILEGELCDIFALNMIFHCAGIEQLSIPNFSLQGDIALGSLERGKILQIRKVEENIQINPGSHFFIKKNGQQEDLKTLDPSKHVLFEGSFNPLHFGHEFIEKEVKMRTGKEVVYVITNSHPVKGPVPQEDLLARVGQFHFLAPVLVTDNLKLFLDKVNAFPGFTFTIGIDTLERIIDPQYYEISVEDILEIFLKKDAHFLVVVRKGEQGLITLDSTLRNIPERFKGMFAQLSTVADVSSTSLREKMK